MRLRRFLIVAATALVILAAGCGEDPPTRAEIEADAAEAGSELASSVGRLARSPEEPVESFDAVASGYEEAIEAAGEVEGGAPEDLVAALEAGRDAAMRLTETANLIVAAREEVSGPDRYERSLAETSARLRDEVESLAELRVSLAAADADALRGPLASLSRELGALARRADALATPHPFGPLEADALATVRFGSPSSRVRRAFGPPDSEQEVNFGLGPAPRFDWAYDAEPDLRIVFNAGSGKLSGYQCIESCSLETASGIGLGDPMAKARREYGSALEEFPVGVGALIVPASGAPGSGGLTFTGNAEGGGKVIAISAFDSLMGPAGD